MRQLLQKLPMMFFKNERNKIKLILNTKRLLFAFAFTLTQVNLVWCGGSESTLQKVKGETCKNCTTLNLLCQQLSSKIRALDTEIATKNASLKAALKRTPNKKDVAIQTDPQQPAKNHNLAAVRRQIQEDQIVRKYNDAIFALRILDTQARGLMLKLYSESEIPRPINFPQSEDVRQKLIKIDTAITKAFSRMQAYTSEPGNTFDLQISTLHRQLETAKQKAVEFHRKWYETQQRLAYKLTAQEEEIYRLEQALTASEIDNFKLQEQLLDRVEGPRSGYESDGSEVSFEVSDFSDDERDVNET